MSTRKILIAHVIDSSSGNWWCKYYGVDFRLLSIREDTVIVKSCSDEWYQPPLNFHEFPKEAVLIQEAILLS